MSQSSYVDSEWKQSGFKKTKGNVHRSKLNKKDFKVFKIFNIIVLFIILFIDYCWFISAFFPLSFIDILRDSINTRAKILYFYLYLLYI